MTKMFTIQLVYLCLKRNIISDKNVNDIHYIISFKSLI